MKHIKYILLSLLICITFACKKDFLELQPQAELTEVESAKPRDEVRGL